MANPNKLWGQSRITANGIQFTTEPKASIEVGGINRDNVDGDNRAGMFSEKTAASKVECSVLVNGDVSLVALQAIDDATVVFECDTGQTYIINHAYVSGQVSASDGKAKVTFMGPSAEEELL